MLPGTYGLRLAAQRRLMLVVAEEIAVTESSSRTGCAITPATPNCSAQGHRSGARGDLRDRDRGHYRFETAAALCCWSGITPRHYESDKTVRRGHISKEGSKLIRWAAVESIQRSCEPAVKDVKDSIIARRGPGP